jgi:hypothetical protein
MKQIYLTLSLLAFIGFKSFGQTTLTEDVNGVLNTGKIVAQTSAGQTFFVGHQLGTGYSYPTTGIFRAWTDNSNGAVNYFYDGVTGSTTTFSVRADGQGYFATNVGVGTTAPLANLHVIGTTLIGGSNLDLTKFNANFLANTGAALIGWNRTSGNGETDFIANQGAGSNGGFAFYNHDNSNNETQLMWISGNGNVQIGIPPMQPNSYKLNVTGGVRANSITVNATGADFVFEPTYKLFSLPEIEKYIQQNHHLPEIPSAKEMQNDGLNVGDNQIKLLQKVEELTLYLIEKDKEIKTQREEINLLKQAAVLNTDKQDIAVLKEEVQKLITLINKK